MSKPLIIKGTILFFVLFAGIAFIYISSQNNKYEAQIQTHADIIADDIWNLNQNGIRTYLNLALKADYFKSFIILQEQGEPFLEIINTAPGSLDTVLEKINLIWSKEVNAPIFYKGSQIGIIKGEKVVRIFYPLINIFLFELSIAIIFIFILYLFYNRKLLEQQVIERTRRYHELVNLLPEMVLETDTSGRLLFANELAVSRFALIDKNITAYQCSDFIIVKSTENAFWVFTEAAKMDQNEYLARRVDGRTFPVLIRSAPIINSNNQITGARVVIVDITDRLAMEEQLSRDQKMKSIGIMAGSVAHDLNNILSGVVNYPELMLMHVPEDSHLRKYIVPMKEAGMRAAAIVADLLTVARGVAATRQLADAKQLIIDYLESPEFYRLLATYPLLQYSTHFDTLPGLISCSDIHVRKCVMNLVTNAAEAMEGNGRITIVTHRMWVDATLSKQLDITKGDYVTISIKDQGPGITPTDLEHIFEPFYTKKEMGRSGTGLGLTIVWNTMEDHDGGIDIKTGPDGTTFILLFPFNSQELLEVPPPNIKVSIKGKGETILIVDDELQQRDIASQLLTSLGYKAEAVSSGEEAIEYLRQKNVDLLLLDMVIGKGLSGRQTYEKILEIRPGQKAVIASGFSESDDVKATLKLGAGRLINKPYTKHQLAKEINAELSR